MPTTIIVMTNSTRVNPAAVRQYRPSRQYPGSMVAVSVYCFSFTLITLPDIDRSPAAARAAEDSECAPADRIAVIGCAIPLAPQIGEIGARRTRPRRGATEP